MQKVLVVEDHQDARREICAIVTEAFGQPEVVDVATLAQAREQIGRVQFDLVVLDLGLPDGRGEDFIADIQAHQRNAYVVISTIHDESDRLLAALQNGAKGYLLKEQPAEHLIGEFRGIAKGKPPLAPAVTRRLLEHLRATGARPPDALPEAPAPARMAAPTPEEVSAVASLTEREREILVLLSKGFSRPEIGGILGISRHTVATHVEKVYRKLGTSTRSEAAVIAEQHHLL